MSEHEFDAVVVGNGLAGGCAALALGRKGLRVAFFAPPAPAADGRTTALMMQSIGFLDALGIWPAVADRSAPLRYMQILDATRRLVRAPCVTFRAGEIGEHAFGYNIPNAALLEALAAAIAGTATIETIETPAALAEHVTGGVRVLGENGREVAAPLAVAADGRHSVLRQAAGIGTRKWSYPQTAVITTFRHAFAHKDTSSEFHTEHGPFTQVPLPGNRSSLVWVMRPADAEVIVTLGPGNMAARIEERMQSILGAVEIDGPVQRYPLSGMIAHAFGKSRTALVGEAAHVFPPIGAQGLNLGLRDVMALAGRLSGPQAAVEAEALVRRYDMARRADVGSRTAAVDLLNRSLLSDFVPMQVARSAGLSAMAAFSPLRRVAMLEGMRPGGSLGAMASRTREKIRRQKPFGDRVEQS